MITTFPLTICCQMLAVDAKTLRSWLAAAEIEPQTASEDTRLKLLTLEQVYHLALLHRRSLRPPVANTPSSQVDPLPDEALLTHSDQLPPDVNQLSQKLAQVEAKLTIVCEQLAQLALLLAQEREQRYEQRITILEACVLAELSG